MLGRYSSSWFHLPSHEFFGRPGHFLGSWPPQVQAVRMDVHILAARWMELYHGLFVLEKHVLDLAHFRPSGRRFPLAVVGGHADMFPPSTVAGDAEKRPAVDEHLERTIA